VHTRSIDTDVIDQGRGETRDEWRDAAWREVAIVTAAAIVYFGVRLIVEGDSATALANADRVIRFEEWLGIDVEQGVQSVVVDRPILRAVGNASYVWLHWPLVIAVLIVVFRRDRGVYVRLRRALVASGAVGLLCFWLMPTSPPRFLSGFEGTVSDAARTHYLRYPLSWANPYASFPSFHVGWTLIACLALASTLESPVARVAVMVPAVLVGFAVVSTGNHFVLDAAVGAAIALVAYLLVGTRFEGARR
jgi:hypothetical protein